MRDFFFIQRFIHKQYEKPTTHISYSPVIRMPVTNHTLPRPFVIRNTNIMNTFSKNRSVKAILALTFTFIVSFAFAGNTTERNDAFKQSLKENLNTEVLQENRLQAAKVLVIFTVAEDRSLNILNTASLQQPIKEYVTRVLNGKVTSDLEPGEAYQMIISFRRY